MKRPGLYPQRVRGYLRCYVCRIVSRLEVQCYGSLQWDSSWEHKHSHRQWALKSIYCTVRCVTNLVLRKVVLRMNKNTRSIPNSARLSVHNRYGDVSSPFPQLGFLCNRFWITLWLVQHGADTLRCTSAGGDRQKKKRDS